MRGAWAVAASAVLLACGGPPPRVVPPPAPPPSTVVEPEPEPELVETGPIVVEDTAAPEGPACMRTAECGSGLACRGVPGCMTSWACGEPREDCGSERVAYCDCDGVTFHAASGCPGRTYAHVGPCDDPGIADASLGIPNGDEPITQRDRTCTSSSECRGGEICYGPPGCGMAWRCERARGCARGGRRSFCSCDGETFTAQTNCPGQPYTQRGACDEVIASLPPTSSSSSPPATSMIASGSTPRATPLEPGQCHTNRDCGHGMVCAGPAGCGDAWTCIRRSDRCNPDTQYFCDCRGESFTASMTCPTRPYLHRGSCAIDAVIDLSGAVLR